MSEAGVGDDVLTGMLATLGRIDGSSEYARVGPANGTSGNTVGLWLGNKLGAMECASIGSIDGSLERALVGILLGNALKIRIEARLGSAEGALECCSVGAFIGTSLGNALEIGDNARLGSSEGTLEGCTVVA